MKQVEINKLYKKFGNNLVIDDFNLSINEGEFITILGPSGCGKTTLLRLLAGFEKSDSGSIEINGDLVDNENIFIKPQFRNISMVFQSYALWPTMNVYENIAYPLKIKKLPTDLIKTRVEYILKLLSINDIKFKDINEISGGQQQRVALARAIVMQNKLLLMDEPLSNLDTKLRENLRNEIKLISKKIGSTVVFVTHDKNEALLLSDRIVVMNKGKIIQIDSPYEIYNNPKSEFVAKFIGDYNIFDYNYLSKTYLLDCLDKDSNNKYVDQFMKIGVKPRDIEILADEKEPSIIEYINYLGDYIDIGVCINKKIVRVRKEIKYIDLFNVGMKVKMNFKNYIYLGENYEKKD